MEGAAKYEIHRSTSKSGTYTRLTATASTTVTNTSAEAGQRYYYKVRAVAADGTVSAFSSAVSRTCDLPQPKVTTNNVSTSGKIQLSWNAVYGARKYEVHRSLTEEGGYTKLLTTTGTSMTNTSAEAGKTYYYKIRAIHENTDANSAYTLVKRACDLPQPKNLKAVNVESTGKIKLSWDAVNGASKYEVYRSTSKSGEYKSISTTASTSMTNTSAEAGTTYYYKVRAIHADSAANSAFSSIVNRTCDLPRPKVTATNVESSGKIKLTWNAVEGATKYEVYRATSKDGTYKRISTTASTGMTNTSAEAGTTYYYKVRAIHSNSSANSAFSSIVNRTCDLAQPKVEATNVESSGKIKLSWKKVSGAVKYEVYRATEKNGTYKRISTTTSTSLTNTSAEAGTTYYYKVRAIHSNSSANSAYSSIINRTCDLPRPNVKITLTSAGNPKMTWDAVEGATKYRIYRANPAGEFELYKTTTKTSFTDSETDPNAMYFYQVMAVHSNSSANSARKEVSIVKTIITCDRETVGRGYTIRLEVLGDGEGCKWSSSDTAIATVSSNGTVTGKKNGSCTIYCTLANGAKLSYKVKVVNPVTLETVYVSDTSILNECGIKFYNNTHKTIEYIEFNIKQYDYKGRRVYGIYDYFYCDWYIDPYDDLTLEYWVDDMAKTCVPYIMEVKFTDGTYWRP